MDLVVESKFLECNYFTGTSCYLNPLLFCAIGGDTQNHIEVAKLLIKKDPSIIDIPNTNGNGPLHYAAMKGHIEMAKLLLNNGASKHLKNSDDKSPEQVAIDNNHEDIGKLINELLQKGQ